MNVLIKHIILFWLILNIPGQSVFSQTYTSRNNYTGDWENPSSWNPSWSAPVTDIFGNNINLNGYITVNGNLSFTGNASQLIINDTLVIKGNLSLGDNNDITINDNGILIIRGSLSIGNQTLIIANGYFIVTSDFIKTSSVGQGSFTCNDNPASVFICGTISPIELTENNPLFPAINCTAPATTRYQSSNCSYGNMTDLINDPIYSFFQSTCLAPKPSVTASGVTTFCDGGSVTLTSSAGSTYLWSTGATTQSINAGISGSYSVKVTNATGCLSAPSSAISVTVNALPVTPSITASGTTSFCSGGNVTLTSSPGSEYLWSNGATSQTINVNTTGSYSVRITDSNGCKSAVSVPAPVSVSIVPVPTVVASGPTTFCEGGDVTLTSDAGTSYLWSNSATTRSINVTSAGNYSVQVTDANGCQSAASVATVVKVNALPVVNAGINATIPYGTNTTLNSTIGGTGPFSYNWTPAGELINASVEDPTTVNLTSSTIFTLVATSSATSCSNKNEVTITISGGPVNATPTASPATVCAGEDVQLHSLASGGSGTYTYTWTSNPVGFTSSIANPVVNPAVTTTYYVTIYDGFNSANSQVTVTVNPLPPLPTVTADGPVTFCAGGSVNLISAAGTDYMWSNEASTQSINVTTTGSYTVRVINSSGCQSASSIPVVVTVNALPATPTITADGPASFCVGESVNLTSSSGTSYQWSNTAASRILSVTSSGSYSVRVTSDKGCISPSSIPYVITVSSLPPNPIIKADGPTTFCEGGTVTLTSSTGASYLWSNGAISQSINVTGSGSYTVQVLNASGCKSAVSAATIIKINPVPATPSVTSSGPLIFCSGGSVTLTSAAGDNYLWSNAATTRSITVSSGDQYSVSIINTSGCESASSAPVEVIVNESPVAVQGPDQELKFTFETTMNALLSGSETGEWSLISGSGHISDIHSPVTRITELAIGENTFQWKVKNSNCETSAVVILTVIDQFVPSVITPNGDGKNDVFKLSEYIGKVEIIIFNRWGNEEYSSRDYINDWDGRNNKGSELPADTYFYILKFENGKILKGSVFVKR